MNRGATATGLPSCLSAALQFVRVHDMDVSVSDLHGACPPQPPEGSSEGLPVVDPTMLASNRCSSSASTRITRVCGWPPGSREPSAAKFCPRANSRTIGWSSRPFVVSATSSIYRSPTPLYENLRRHRPHLEALPAVGLAPQAFDEILGTSILPFGETLAYLTYYHIRRAVPLQPAQQLLLADRELDPSQVPLEVTGEYVPQKVRDKSPLSSPAPSLRFTVAETPLRHQQSSANPPQRDLRLLA